MRLDLGLNLAATMLARDGRCRVIGRGIEFVGAAGLDFVTQRRSLAIGDRGKTRRGRATLLRPGFDRDVRKASLLQIAPDQRSVVIAVRRAGQEARRILWKKLRERMGHIVGKHVLLDTVPG